MGWHPLCKCSDRGCATNKTTANIELKAYEYFNYVRDTGRINYTPNTHPDSANAAGAAGRNAASHSGAATGAASAGTAARSEGAADTTASSRQDWQGAVRSKPLK